MAHPILPTLLRRVWVAAVGTLLTAGAAIAVDGRRTTTNDPTDVSQVVSERKNARQSALVAVLVTCGVPAWGRLCYRVTQTAAGRQWK